MTRSNSVRLKTLTSALADLVARGYGDCPVFVETARDVGPLYALVFRQRGGVIYLSETIGGWSLGCTVTELPKTERGKVHE